MWGGRRFAVVVVKNSVFNFKPPSPALFIGRFVVPSTYFSTSSVSPVPLQVSKKSSLRMLEGVEMNWDFRSMSGEDINSMANSLIERCKKVYDDVGTARKVSKETVLEPLLESDRWSSNEGHLLTFIKNVAASKELRDASNEVTEKLDKASVELAMRVDVFEKLEQLEKTEGNNLTGEIKRILEKKVKDGRRNGLHLDETVRTQLKEIKERLSKLSIEFQKNCNEENELLYFTRDELAGLPDPFLDSLKVEEGGNKLQVTLKYPHVFPITMKCCVPETRKQLETAFNSQCKQNVALLEEALELRQKEADLLGYANHAAYMQDVLMAKDPASVAKFLNDLKVKLQPLWGKEKEELLELKKLECEKRGLEFDGKLNPWDTRYYSRRLEEEKYAVDKEALKPYFPIAVVTQGLLAIYETLLSLKFTKVSNAPVWHDEVTCYKVEDADTKNLLGYFYMDLHPREGKFGHNACMPLQQGYVDSNQKLVPHVVAMVCNFSPPQGDRPSLLSHDEVETFFHEFGHIMHCICSRTQVVTFAGPYAVERDFIECPSQMLENWVWYPEPLKKMSKHYETGEAIPDDIVEKLVASQKANAGGFNIRQVSLALFDQEIHSGGRCNVGEVYARRVKETVGIDVIPGTNMPATFLHVMGGYSARYYSYLWSEVYSADMFETRFGKDRLFCQENGKAYRDFILRPGGSADAADMLRNFLGRDPEVEPFLKCKGLSL